MTARSARLATLASALTLPAPVRESFLFAADAAFVAQCTASDVELQRAAKRVLQHAALPCDATVVVWKQAPPQPARADRDGATWFLELDAVFKTDGRALAVLLAREAARAALLDRGIAAPTPIDIELAALLLGFGAILVAAPRPAGPYPRPVLRALHARVCASLRIGLARTLDLPLAPRALRFSLAVTYLVARVVAGALRFAPAPPHVIIRCFCARRLRVPTGALGQTTCPACKRRRPFDGRACRTLAA